MKCQIFRQGWEPEKVRYFNLSEFKGMIYLNVYDIEGHYLATIVSIDENGIYLDDGLPSAIGLPTDKKGRIMLINDDLKEAQRKTKRDLPLERVE